MGQAMEGAHNEAHARPGAWLCCLPFFTGPQHTLDLSALAAMRSFVALLLLPQRLLLLDAPRCHAPPTHWPTQPSAALWSQPQ